MNSQTNYDKSIDDFFADFLQYRKDKENNYGKNIVSIVSKNKPKIVENAKNIMPLPLELGQKTIDKIKNDTDGEYVKLLYNRLSKQLLLYVDKILKNWDYEGSPIYNKNIDRDTIGTIVDQVIYLAKNNIHNIEKIFNDNNIGDWGTNEMLRSIVELLVINEIYLDKRPTTKYSFGDVGVGEIPLKMVDDTSKFIPEDDFVPEVDVDFL